MACEVAPFAGTCEIAQEGKASVVKLVTVQLAVAGPLEFRGTIFQ